MQWTEKLKIIELYLSGPVKKIKMQEIRGSSDANFLLF